MSAIKAGDICMVVRAQPCCRLAGNIGHTFVATFVEKGFGKCNACGTMTYAVIVSDDHHRNMGYHASRLIKIEPPAQDEGVEQAEELTA